MKIVLKGYFGAGNLGDDILLAVVHNAVREVLPETPIIVSVAHKAAYLDALLGGDCEIRLRSEMFAEPHVLVYAGGGQFFGFQGGSFKAVVKQCLLRSLGVARCERARRALRLVAMPASFPKVHAAGAVGIGVGPFSLGSSDEYMAANRLNDCTFILVRDEVSQRECVSWRLATKPVVSADISFARQRWLTETEMLPPPKGKRTIAMIIRHWPYGDGNAYLDGLLGCAKVLRNEGIGIRFVSLCAGDDSHVLERLLRTEDVLVYDPSKNTVAEFAAQLALFGLVVSSRAHGLFVAACLGLPAIAIEIEPKLHLAALTLGPCTGSWRSPFRAEVLCTLIRRWVCSSDIEGLPPMECVRTCESSAEQGISMFQNWLLGLQMW